ncbi:MAG: hypothetical protein JJ895_05050 [Balneolaceae bacterium]|nr:hypothetical protein [Balneolaceae bacterium]
MALFRIVIPCIVLLFIACQPSAEKAIPSPRSGFALVYNEMDKSVLLFGGSDSTNTLLGDTWKWDIKSGWTQIEVKGPSPRADAQFSYDSIRDEVVIFGGRTSDGRTKETWVWDGNSWALADTTGPLERQLGAMAFDKSTNNVVLFGGSGQGRARLNDTWLWDGTTWTEMKPDSIPSARGAHLMAFNNNSGRVALIGGYSNIMESDHWEWDGSNWILIDDKSTPPRLHGSLAFNSELNALMIFGGFSAEQREQDVWIYDGNQWVDQSAPGPEVRAEHEGVYLPDVGFFSFGGIIGQDMATSERVKTNESWIFTNSTWTKVE